MSNPNAAFDRLSAITYDNRDKKMIESILEHNAAMDEMEKRGKIKTKDGGTYISHNIQLEENGTIQNISGADPIDISPNPGPSVVQYPWSMKAMSVAETTENIAKNSGRSQLIDLVDAAVDTAIWTSTNLMNLEFHGDGTLVKSLYGLRGLFADNGLGAVGGINAANYSRWANKFHEMAGTNTWSKDTIEAEFLAMFLKTENGPDKTNMILSTNDIYSAYSLKDQEKVRYVGNSSDRANNGFDEIYYRGIKVIRDINANFTAAGERAWFLNLNWMYLFEHPTMRWTPEKDRMPVNALMVVKLFTWMGNMAVTKRRSQGVLLDAA
jgi:hypothetical protein